MAARRSRRTSSSLLPENMPPLMASIRPSRVRSPMLSRKFTGGNLAGPARRANPHPARLWYHSRSHDEEADRTTDLLLRRGAQHLPPGARPDLGGGAADRGA